LVGGNVGVVVFAIDALPEKKGGDGLVEVVEFTGNFDSVKLAMVVGFSGFISGFIVGACGATVVVDGVEKSPVRLCDVARQPIEQENEINKSEISKTAVNTFPILVNFSKHIALFFDSLNTNIIFLS
jgi:hypothetical protein